MQLRITDGTTTVDLAGATTGIKGVTYFPMPGDGQESVSETAEVVGSGTEAQIRSAANSIERLLGAARRRQRLGTGPRVFVEYRPVTTDVLWRSELFDGRIVWSDDPGARQLRWTNPTVKYALLLTRAPWWEGPETELQLSASGQAAATGGRTVTNDAVSNWVQVASTQVTGTLPAPVRLQLRNTTGAAQFFRDFYLGLNAFSAPTTFGHVLQGESRVAGYGSTYNSGTLSGGSSLLLSVGTSGGYAAMWLLPAAMMAAGGRWFRLVGRFPSPLPSDLTMRPSIWDRDGLVQLWAGQSQVLDSSLELQDLGSIPIPPGAWSADYAQVRLALWMQAQSSSNVYVDYLAVLGMDSYRQVVQVGMQMEVDDSVEIDDIEGRVSGVEVAGTRVPYFVAHGEPLVVYPNTTQRLCIVEGLTTGSAPISHTFSARLWYRPRRSTV